MNNLLRKSKMFCKRNSSTFLTVVGAVGVIATSVMAVKATPKALLLINEEKNTKGGDLTKLEVIKATWPVYIPAAVTGVATITCIFGSNIIDKKRQAALTSAYMWKSRKILVLLVHI